MKLLLVVLLCFNLASYGQNKIFLKKESFKSKIEEGMFLMPIYKGDTNTYSSWTHTYKESKQLPKDSIWIVDSIFESGDILLKKIRTFEFDTITKSTYRKQSREEKRAWNKIWSYDTTVFLSNKNNDSIYQIYYKPLYSYMKLNLNEIAALRFAKSNGIKDKKYRNMLIGTITVGGGVSTYLIYGLISSNLISGIIPLGSIIYIVLYLDVLYDCVKLIHYSKVKTYNLGEWKIEVKK